VGYHSHGEKNGNVVGMKSGIALKDVQGQNKKASKNLEAF
jgi:hypothetical protein